MPKVISVKQAAELQNAGSLLVDVREIEEFNAVAALSAINVPLSLIQKNGNDAYRNMGINPNTEDLLLICRSGVRSAVACDLLGENAINVEGGMLAWQAADLPTR